MNFRSFIVACIFLGILISPRLSILPIHLVDLFLPLIFLCYLRNSIFMRNILFSFLVFVAPYLITFNVNYYSNTSILILIKYTHICILFSFGCVESLEIKNFFNSSFFRLILLVSTFYLFMELIGFLPNSDLMGLSEATHYGVCTIGECAVFQSGGIVLLLLISAVYSFWRSEHGGKFTYLIISLILLISLVSIESRATLIGLIFSIVIAFRIYKKPLFIYILIFSILLIIYIQKFLQFDSRYSFDVIISAIKFRAENYFLPVFNRPLMDQFLGEGLLAGTKYFPGDDGEVHNYYLRIFLEGGVYAFLSFFYFLYKLLKYLPKDVYFSKYNLITNIYFFMMIFSALVQDSFYSSIPMYIFSLLLGASVKGKIKTKFQ